MRILAIVLLCLGVVALAGCSSKTKLVSGAPDWVNMGSGAFDDDGSKMFYGVGVVTGISSPSLSRETAEQRARAEIARQLQTYVTDLYRDYQVATDIRAGQPAQEEQHIDATLKSLAEITVRGAKVVEFWRQPDTDTIYALAKLDVTGFKSAIVDMGGLDPGFRGYVREHAEQAFDSLKQPK
jgi:hypothetical protein